MAVESTVSVGVVDGVISAVGVGVGVTVVVGRGRKRAAATPMRMPKRMRATAIKKILRKPDFLGGWAG